MAHLLSRSEYEEWVKTLPPGDCAFCRIGDQLSLGESKHWYWVANLSPYWRYHTLLIPKRHRLDITEVTADEFRDLKKFDKEIITHLSSLNLTHVDGKPIDQFLILIRTRREGVEGGSTYHKPSHLHIHFVPDREGVERYVLDSSAIDVDMQALALPKSPSLPIPRFLHGLRGILKNNG